MFQSIIDDIKKTFREGNMVSRLIVVNISVYIFVNLVYVFTAYTGGESQIYQFIIRNLAIPSEPIDLLLKPWTLFTHMFLHERIWHMAWNMIIFYWFGKIVGDLIGDRHILPLYILGGLTGAFVYMISAQVIGVPGYALGASAAVMAMVLAAAVISPDYIMHLLLIGPVKIKFIALAIVLFDLIGTANTMDSGGHWAHLGGALFGWFFVAKMGTNTDFLDPIRNFFDRLRNGNDAASQPQKSPLKVSYKSRKLNSPAQGERKSDLDYSHQEKLDLILDKIKQQGFEKLSEEEKEFLYQASKKP